MTKTAIDYYHVIEQELGECDGTLSESIHRYIAEIMSSGIPSADREELFVKLAQSTVKFEAAIYFYSIAVHAEHSADVLESLLDYCWSHRDEIGIDTLNYLYGQISHIMFVFSELNTFDTTVKAGRILNYVIGFFESELSDLIRPIPKEERNQDFVLVLTNQFISFLHGPTKTAADRCKILMENMNKNVLLMNTAELLTLRGYVPFWDCYCGSYDEKLLNAERIEWKSCVIPYFQCDNNMPDVDEIRILLSAIRSQKPAYIISIGSGNVVAALASKIIPALCVGLVPSTLGITGVYYQTLSRSLNDYDKKILQAFGRPESSVIIGTFGSSILPQKNHLTREELGLPAESWLAVLVGGRLNRELDETFWNMADKAALLGMEYVILGQYDQSDLDAVVKAHPSLFGKIHPMGIVQDVLSYMELCDLYINPIRRGGGTSCVEAMSIGIPVLTTDFGDVAVNVGEQFHTDSYETMLELIQRYMTDIDFYQKQSQAAKERSAKLLNAEEAFISIVTDFLARADSE